jgi:hypothetical protein
MPGVERCSRSVPQVPDTGRPESPRSESERRPGTSDNGSDRWPSELDEIAESRCGSGSSSRRGAAQEPAVQGKTPYGGAIRQQPVMRNALRTGRKCVQQEATDELVRFDGHGPGALRAATVLPAEAHLALARAQQSLVIDGHAMGLPAEVSSACCGPQKGCWTAEHAHWQEEPRPAGREEHTRGDSVAAPVYI